MCMSVQEDINMFCFVVIVWNATEELLNARFLIHLALVRWLSSLILQYFSSHKEVLCLCHAITFDTIL